MFGTLRSLLAAAALTLTSGLAMAQGVPVVTMPGAPGTASSPGNADAAIIAANAAFGGNWTSNNAGRQFLACSDAVDYCVKWEVTITGGLNWISSGIRSSFGGIWDAISEFFGWSAYGPDGQPMGGSAGYPGGYTGCGSLVYCVDM